MNILVAGTFDTTFETRHELHIATCLVNDFNYNVFTFDYFKELKKSNSVITTRLCVEAVVKNEIDVVFLIPGRYLNVDILKEIKDKRHNTTIINWYHDYLSPNMHPIKWFYDLCSICDISLWTLGDNKLRNLYLSSRKEHPYFELTLPHSHYFHPVQIEKNDLYNKNFYIINNKKNTSEGIVHCPYRHIDDIRRRCLNIEKIRSELKWILKTTLCAGLEKTYKFLTVLPV